MDDYCIIFINLDYTESIYADDEYAATALFFFGGCQKMRSNFTTLASVIFSKMIDV